MSATSVDDNSGKRPAAPPPASANVTISVSATMREDGADAVGHAVGDLLAHGVLMGGRSRLLCRRCRCSCAIPSLRPVRGREDMLSKAYPLLAEVLHFTTISWQGPMQDIDPNARHHRRPSAGRLVPRTNSGAGRALGVTGWVRNLPDGSVEAVFEGEPAAVAAAVEWCRGGPPHAVVESVSTFATNLLRPHRVPHHRLGRRAFLGQ